MVRRPSRRGGDDEGTSIVDRAGICHRLERSGAGAGNSCATSGELRSFSGSTEFLFVGSCVHGKAPVDGLFAPC